MEQIRCVATLANLEGLQHTNLPASAAEPPSLSNVDARLRALEASQSITPPPPVSDVSWSSIAWRLWRLRYIFLQRITTITQRQLPRQTANASFLSAEDQSRITLQGIKGIVDTCTPLYKFGEWPKCATDDEMFSVILQRLSHVMGQKNEFWEDIPITLLDLYVAAAEFSFKCETPTVQRTMPPPGWDMIARPRGMNRYKVCCGCCACQCHSPTPLNAHKRGFGNSPAGMKTPSWLKKILFWRRKNRHCHLNHASSSSSDGTLAD